MTNSPTLRRHRRSGHGYARFEGRQVWFGPYDDPETHQRFARTLAEWVANGRRLPPQDSWKNLRVADVVAAYLEFAKRFYSGPDGKPTREVENIRNSVRLLLKLYGTLLANEFGLRQLKTLREQKIRDGLGRKTINDRINRVVRLFGWAAEEELCQAEVYGALRALRSLKRGRSAAKEGKRLLPVPWAHVEATLPHVTRPMAGMIELMWHTGMRPGEVCQLRPADLDRSGPVWLYRPRAHKTQHFERERVSDLRNDMTAGPTSGTGSPAGFTSEGLPVGIQLVGRYRDDLGLLQLANAFEQATGFGRKRPAIALS